MTFSFSQSLRSKEHQNLSGRLRPSGRFSFAQIFPKKSKVLNHGKSNQTEQIPLRTVQQIDESYARLLSGGGVILHGLHGSPQGGVPDIGSSIAANSQKRSPRGSRGITASQRDVLCWAANQLERVYTRRCMSFLTLTLPELSEADLEAVQSNWSKIVHSVQDEIKRELKKNGISSSIVGCTELQLERQQSDGRVWPHLHLVFRGRRDANSQWLVSPARFREIWRRCVGRVVPSDSYPWASSENVQQVRKSCGGYLAKYISKNQSKGAGTVPSGWYPSDWIVCSRRLRGLYKTLTVSGYEIALTLSHLCKHWTHGMGYKQPIIISTPAYGDRIIGQWGWLKGEAIFVSPRDWYASA